MDLLTGIFGILVKAIIENAGTIIAFVVGTVIAIIGLYYAVKGYRLSKQEAEKAPRIEIRLYNQNPDDTVYFVLPFKPNRQFLIPLSLTIKNEGSVSAKDVEVFMEMNDSLYFRDAERRISGIAAARNVVGCGSFRTTLFCHAASLKEWLAIRERWLRSSSWVL